MYSYSRIGGYARSFVACFEMFEFFCLYVEHIVRKFSSQRTRSNSQREANNRNLMGFNVVVYTVNILLINNAPSTLALAVC